MEHTRAIDERRMEAELGAPDRPPDWEAFPTFYAREYPRLVGLAYALSGSRSGAEDLAQEAFIAAYRAWDRIARYDRPDLWLRRVVSNRAVSVLRRRMAEARALTRLGSQPIPELPETDHGFWAAVRSLPRRQAQVLTLHYLEDRPVADIALILDVAEGTVKAHLYAGRASLARLLGEEEA